MKNKNLILKDLNAIFDCIVYERCGNNFIEVHLQQGVKITFLDFPHLLTIANNYSNLLIHIFVVQLNQLGIFIEEAQRK